MIVKYLVTQYFKFSIGYFFKSTLKFNILQKWLYDFIIVKKKKS